MMETRTAAREDDLFLCEVYSSTRLEEVSAWGWEDKDCKAFLSMQWRMQTNSYQLQFPDSENLILSYEGTDAGRMMLNKAAEKIHLIDISLLPPFRNRGIGTSILKNLQQEALMNQQIIELHVTPYNPARRLYERLGFQLSESLDFYWKMVWKPLHSTIGL
ncbi:GNAT family N-acetyltransferase [Paenibacillus solisilvae]|uniref:GNAT family N-acetyltransferase n=1 Tax=Paenibacillus solisilvae TaxID=2486751 RepID=A0ABW0VV76_9BACL